MNDEIDIDRINSKVYIPLDRIDTRLGILHSCVLLTHELWTLDAFHRINVLTVFFNL